MAPRPACRAVSGVCRIWLSSLTARAPDTAPCPRAQVDVWSAGVILGAMYYGMEPYTRDVSWESPLSEPNSADKARIRSRGGWPFSGRRRHRANPRFTSRAPPLCLDELIQRCLHPSMYNRPTAVQVREDKAYDTISRPPSSSGRHVDDLRCFIGAGARMAHDARTVEQLGGSDGRQCMDPRPT